MLTIFKRDARSACPGEGEVAVTARVGATVPAGCTGLAFDGRGNLQRFPGGSRIAAGKDWSACVFHPGPYQLSLSPYPQAPEAGLQVRLLVDTPDPRFGKQRFDLFLAGEAGGSATVALLHEVLEGAVRRELASGTLFLPPCTSVDEWNAFRRGFDELVYTRTGMIVDDCVPADLGETVDYASQLADLFVPAQAGTHAASGADAQHGSPLSRGRQEEQPARPVVPAQAGTDAASGADARHGSPPARGRPPTREPRDDHALRRLFLELPALSARLRVALPASRVPFLAQRALLARLDHAGVLVDTMPSLGRFGPSSFLPAREYNLRLQAGQEALAALDDAWALLARMQAQQAGDVIAESGQIAARLETALVRRRAGHTVRLS